MFSRGCGLTVKQRPFPMVCHRTSLWHGHLDLYLKSIPRKPDVLPQLLWYTGNFLNGRIEMIERDGSF